MQTFTRISPRTRIIIAFATLITVVLMLMTTIFGQWLGQSHTAEDPSALTADNAVHQRSEDAPAVSEVPTEVVRIIDADTITVKPVNGALASTDDDMTETTTNLIEIPSEPSAACTLDASSLAPGDPIVLIQDPAVGTHDSLGRAQGCLITMD